MNKRPTFTSRTVGRAEVRRIAFLLKQLKRHLSRRARTKINSQFLLLLGCHHQAFSPCCNLKLLIFALLCTTHFKPKYTHVGHVHITLFRSFKMFGYSKQSFKCFSSTSFACARISNVFAYLFKIYSTLCKVSTEKLLPPKHTSNCKVVIDC